MSLEKFFGNRFDSHNITNTRLANFAEDSLNRFKKIAVGGQFAATITELTLAVDNLREELGAVNTAKDTRKTKTLRVNTFIRQFKATMSELEGAMAFATGSINSDAYRAFYPNGLTEYSNATKTTMPELVIRINNALTTYDTVLNADIKLRMSGFYTQWHSLRNQQETLKSKVADNRTARTDARQQMELALTKAVATVTLEFPLEPDKCGRFFDFNMLLPVRHHKEEEMVESSAATSSEDD